MAKAPKDRYETAGDFGREAVGAATGEGKLSKATAKWSPSRRWRCLCRCPRRRSPAGRRRRRRRCRLRSPSEAEAAQAEAAKAASRQAPPAKAPPPPTAPGSPSRGTASPRAGRRHQGRRAPPRARPAPGAFGRAGGGRGDRAWGRRLPRRLGRGDGDDSPSAEPSASSGGAQGGPDPGYAKSLSASFKRLNAAVNNKTSALRQAGTNSAQAGELDDLAGAYATAAVSLRKLNPSADVAPLNKAIVAALGDERDAYRRMASAARAGDEAEYTDSVEPRRAAPRCDSAAPSSGSTASATRSASGPPAPTF